MSTARQNRNGRHEASKTGHSNVHQTPFGDMICPVLIAIMMLARNTSNAQHNIKAPATLYVGSLQSTCSVIGSPPSLAYVIFKRKRSFAGGAPWTPVIRICCVASCPP